MSEKNDKKPYPKENESWINNAWKPKFEGQLPPLSILFDTPKEG